MRRQSAKVTTRAPAARSSASTSAVGSPTAAPAAPWASRSARTRAAVSCASGMFAAMMPVGPRFSQPDTYKPPVGSSTRPCVCGTRPRPSAGKPCSGVMPKPTLRTRRPQGTSSICAVSGTKATWAPASPFNSVRTIRNPPTRPGAPGNTSTGDDKNRTQMTRFDVESFSAKFFAILSRMSRDRFFIRLLDSSCSEAALSESSNSAGSTTASTSS
mmetsp:Transcript_106519/g.306257  ORF Transcript_106519/g.306257 Transcript_106519/m.306257 type:complete len:215 (-) Transcript_106519:847-1491(-)